MKLSRLVALHLAVLGCLPVPACFAQKREDILSIQRDVAQLQDQIKQLQTSQDQKMAELESLIKQALDQSNQASGSMAALQRTSLTDLPQRSASQSFRRLIAVLGTKVDQSAD